MTSRSRRPAPAARAFTMLEVTLAAVLGGLVIIACLAVFGSMDGMDRALARRADDTEELARLHVVMSRTFSTLVMSDQPVPNNPNTPGAPGTQPNGNPTPTPTPATPTPTPSTSGAGSKSASTSKTSGAGSTTGASPAATPSTTPASDTGDAGDKAAAPPRFLIAASPTLAPTPANTTPQRLEVVIAKAPIADPRAPVLAPARITQSATVPAAEPSAPKPGEDASTALKSASPTPSASGPGTGSGSGSGSESAGGTSDQSAEAQTRTVETTGEAAGVRGYFELVPESALPAESATLGATPPRAGGRQPMALIWRQLPLASQLASATPPPAAQPIVVARGLESLRWRAFDDRERKDLFSATWSRDLPAYVEMEVRTIAGLYVNWMFEVEWTQGPEPGEPPAATARRGLGAGGGGGGGGGPGQGPGVGAGARRALRTPGDGQGRRAAPTQVFDGGPGELRERRRRGPRDFEGRPPGDFNPRDLPPPPPPPGQPRPTRARPAQPQGGPR